LKKIQFQSLESYVAYFRRLVKLEREAEKNFHLKEIKNLTGHEREKVGRAILKLSARPAGELIGGYKLIKFYRRDMPDHQISVGDVVLLSKKSPLKDGIEGTVYEKGQNYITVAFDREFPFKKAKGSFRIDLYINDITFRRMLDTLTLIENRVSKFPLEVLLGRGEVEVNSVEFESDDLNESQVKAAQLALGSTPVFLVHGPPGTGKTTTLVKIIKELVERRNKILATADSNNAVDNLVVGLIKEGLKVVRLGHPARLDPALLKVSLDYMVEHHDKYEEIKKIDEKVEKIRSKQTEFKKPIPSLKRGLTDEEIFNLAQKGKGARGVSFEIIKSMAKWIDMQREINSLVSEKIQIYNKIVEEILSRTDVVCTTNSTAGSDLLLGITFDVAVIDEATQATEPSSLIPLIKAKKLIMAGDHKQLPPTILNPEAQALSFTLFERFLENYPEASYMLRIQYRMNEKIMMFPSIKFYDGKLIAHPSVRNITLSQIVGSEIRDPILDDTPVVFVDTCRMFKEKVKRGSFSKYNPREAEFVKKLVDKLIGSGVIKNAVGIITPYKDHEDYLKDKIPGVEIHTVDGFQGREKEIIILSLVRSNQEQEIGFLNDLRRINVALTRAKRKLIIIGDAETLTSNSFFHDLIQYVKNNGKFVSLEANCKRSLGKSQ